MKNYHSDDLIPRDASLHIFTSTASSEEAWHSHDFIELVYIKSGTATQFVNEDRFEVKHGDLVFINYGSTHRFCPHEEFSYINICFSPEVLEDGIITPENAFGVLQLTAFDEIRRESEEGMITFESGERNSIEALLFSMLEEYKSRVEGWQAVLKSYMNILIIRMLRKTSFCVDACETSDMWQDLLRYIDENLGSDLTLSVLAQKCFYNPSYFSRVFKEKFGMTLTEYVSRRKLHYAAALAAENRLSTAQIASQAGFSTVGALYRTCKKLMGVTFSELRKG